jgi:hypothetical protein
MNFDHLIWPTDGWGYMPPQEDVFAPFHYIRDNYNPKNVLEIGFCWGHSTTYQLEIYKDASMVCVGPIAEDNLSKEVPDSKQRQTQIDKMYQVYGDRFKHLAGRTHVVQYDLLESYVDYFDVCLIDGYHKSWAVEVDSILCQDLNIPIILVDNWDQDEVQSTVKKFTDYETIEVFTYNQTWKGTDYQNEMAICRLT